MEPHRWLPLEANPDVSARPGPWVAAVCAGDCPPDSLPAVRWAGGWRRGEGRGLRAAPGHIAAKVMVGSGRDGGVINGEEVLHRGSDWVLTPFCFLLSLQVTNQVRSIYLR